MKYVIDQSKMQQLIEERGFSSLNAFSAYSGVHRNTLRAYLNGEESVFRDVVRRIADVLKIDPLALVEIKSSTESSTREYEILVAALGKIAFDIMNCQTEGQGTSCRLSFCLLGSRARGTDRKYSDWDIGVTGGRSPIATSLFLSLKIAVDDVTEDFVRGVDLINLDEAPLWFLKKIDYQPVFLAGSQSAFDFMCGIIDGVKRDG